MAPSTASRSVKNSPHDQISDSTELDPTVDVAEVAARLRLSITRLARRLRQEAEIGLSPTMLSTLAVIGKHGPLTLGRLAEIESVAPPTITKVVQRLEDAGLAERVCDSADRRVRHVECTKSGHELLQTSRERKNAWLAAKLGEASPDERQTVVDALQVLEQLSVRNAE